MCGNGPCKKVVRMFLWNRVEGKPRQGPGTGRRPTTAASSGGCVGWRRSSTKALESGVNPEKSLLKPLGLVQPLVSSRRRAATSNRGGWTGQSGAAMALIVPANSTNGPRVWPMPRIPAARMRLSDAIRAGHRYSRCLRRPAFSRTFSSLNGGNGDSRNCDDSYFL